MIRLAVWAILAGVLAAGPAAAQTDRLSPHALQAFLDKYLNGKPAQSQTAWADLNGDRRAEAVVYVSGQDWCGSGGCLLLVLRQNGDDFQVVGRTTVVRPPIIALRHRTHGWRDLMVEVGGGGATAGHAVLSFAGKRYASNPTTPPAHLVLRPPHGRVLIADEGVQSH